MSEAELIEIAQRHRKLEDAIERTKPHVGAARKRAENELENIHRETRDSDTLTRWQAQEMTRLENLEATLHDLPIELEECAEACRDDMNALCDLVRGMK